jgi:hypothetical protein
MGADRPRSARSDLPKVSDKTERMSRPASKRRDIMKKAFPIGLMIIGLVFLAGGIYTVTQGLDARAQVRDELVTQAITTPEDASIPNVAVTDAATAQSMADIIGVHSLEATGGRSYAELGRYLTPDGTDTSDETLALKDEAGNPVPNPIRNVAFQATSLRTSLYTSVMAFKVSELVIGLGVMVALLGFVIVGVGIALGALAIPALGRRLHVDPVVAART